MAELHENQIAFSAGRTAKGRFVAEKDYLAQPLAELGVLAMDTANTIAAYEDNQLKTSLNDSAIKAQNELKNARSLDANYDEIGDAAIAEWNSILDSAPAGARERFLRASPYAADEYAIGVRANVLEKQQKQIYNRSKLDIAQWSSQIVNAPEDQQQSMLEAKRIAIQNLGLPMEETDNLLFDLQSQVDQYRISYFIANKQFDKAKAELEKGLPTYGAAQRANTWIQLQSAIESESQRLAEEEKNKLKAMEAGVDPQINLALSMHQHLLAMDRVEDAKEFRDKFFAGEPIMATTNKGEPVVIHSSDIPVTLRDKFYGQMITSANRAPANNKFLADYYSDFNRLANGRMNSDGTLADGVKMNPAMAAMADKLLLSELGFNEALSEKERVFVRNVKGASGNSMIDTLALNPEAQFKATNVVGVQVQKANPMANIAAMRQIYSQNPYSAYQSVQTQGKTLTGREVDSFNEYTKKFKDEYFSEDYKLKSNTRADALANLFALIAYPGYDGMSPVGLNTTTRENFADKFYSYMDVLMQSGTYEDEADIGKLRYDFRQIYKSATGFDFPEQIEEVNNQLAINLALAYTSSAGRDKGEHPKLTEKQKAILPSDASAKSTLPIIMTHHTGNLFPTNTRGELERKRRTGEL